MHHKKLDDILKLVLEFAHANDKILAVGLCGSWARGNPSPESDIDLSIITANKDVFKHTLWLGEIPFKELNESAVRFEDIKYGRVWSRHVFLESGAEIEFSFADRSWAEADPIDEGTKKVVSDGYRILYDPHKILCRLVNEINSNP